MSILLVEVVPQGILLGADRNITETRTSGGASIEIHGQSQRPKVLRWPRNKALVGYVGAAEIGAQATDDWLYDFIGDNPTISNFDALAEDLRERVEAQRQIDEGSADPQPLIIHLAGFEDRAGSQVPVVWYIRNAFDLGPDGYQTIRKTFNSSEELWQRFPTCPPAGIREALANMADNFEPFWFHQGLDLGTFNTIETYLKAAFRLLSQSHADHTLPAELGDWERQVRMSILTYGAYFAAYKGVSEQYVGGGADVVSMPWP